MPVIPATWEVKIVTSQFKTNSGQNKNVNKTLSQRISWVGARVYNPKCLGSRGSKITVLGQQKWLEAWFKEVEHSFKQV
jgi:hypothetical protein